MCTRLHHGSLAVFFTLVLLPWRTSREEALLMHFGDANKRKGGFYDSGCAPGRFGSLETN